MDKKQENERIKFYTPIEVKSSQKKILYNGIKLPEEIALNYVNDIQNAIKANMDDKEFERGLAVYIQDENLNKEILSIMPDIEEYEGKLYGVANVKLKKELTNEEMNSLKDYIRGQYSDGWGEGFEQKDIKTQDGEINVSLWNDENFYIKSEKELKGKDGIETKEIKLYSPLNVLTFDEEMYYTYFYSSNKEMVTLKDLELISYTDEINDFMKEIEYEDIMERLSEINRNLYKKIVNIQASTEKYNCDLYLATEVIIKEKLDNQEIDTLKDCISEKYTSFKDEFEVNAYDYKEVEQISIDFNNNGNFFINTEEEFKNYIEEENKQSIEYTM